MAIDTGLGLPTGTERLRMPDALGSTRTPPGAPAATSFADHLVDLARRTNDLQRSAAKQSVSFADGRQNDIHGTMIAMQKAEISLRLLASVRNRLIEAYREVMRMGS